MEEPQVVIEREVTVPFDIEAVESVLAAVDHIRDVLYLSPLTVAFTPPDASSDPFDVSFSFVEAVPVLCGLFTKRIEVKVRQRFDKDTHSLLYESKTRNGLVAVRKVRMFTPTEEATPSTPCTRIKETLHIGVSNCCFVGIVRSEADKAHAAHMRQYAELIESMVEAERGATTDAKKR